MVDLTTTAAPLRTVHTDPRFWNQIGPFGGWPRDRGFVFLGSRLIGIRGFLHVGVGLRLRDDVGVCVDRIRGGIVRVR